MEMKTLRTQSNFLKLGIVVHSASPQGGDSVTDQIIGYQTVGGTTMKNKPIINK